MNKRKVNQTILVKYISLIKRDYYTLKMTIHICKLNDNPIKFNSQTQGMPISYKFLTPQQYTQVMHSTTKIAKLKWDILINVTKHKMIIHTCSMYTYHSKAK